MGNKIKFYNRYSKSIEEEKVYAEPFLRFLYGSSLGKLTLNSLIKRKIFSTVYGRIMKRPSSQKRILPFVEQYHINTDVLEKKIDEFESFDAFFSRKLRPSARPITSGTDKLVFPCDGRHLLIENFKEIPPFFVKGQLFDLRHLLLNETLFNQFKNGVALISRLCPADYHRFHFPCDAIIQKIYRVNGDYRSVSPIATQKDISILLENKRIVSLLHSENFGAFLMIEVGATCVGSITETASAGKLYPKGHEKGYFSFGGSTVISIFLKDRIIFNEDLKTSSQNGLELFALMGDEMGIKV